ncbi:MAG TPA: phage portal protein [Sphingobium sp.]|nr:phage portal protein [Sphingobium sp.]
MSKRARRRNRQQVPQQMAAANDNRTIEAFTFGDAEPVLDRATVLDMLECWRNDRWYEPPVSVDGLARAYRVSPHHSSAIMLKCNLLAGALEPTPMLARGAFKAAVQDYLVFGNCYFEQIANRLGGLLRLDHSLAKYTRRGIEAGRYWWVPTLREAVAYEPGRMLHLRAPDVNQELYGVPEYLSALQSALLNESATLFRRRYYNNGSHAGFILYATGHFADSDMDKMREALKRSKGPGNFRNMIVHAPDGKENGIRLLPIAEVGAKDEFLGIKNTTRDDVLAAHRVPPQLLGMVPANAGGFGDVSKALGAFWEMEILPLMAVFLEVNERLGAKVIDFQERAQAT